MNKQMTKQLIPVTPQEVELARDDLSDAVGRREEIGARIKDLNKELRQVNKEIDEKRYAYTKLLLKLEVKVG